MVKRIRKAIKRQREIRKWVADNQRNREWLLTHPARVESKLRRAAINYTEVCEAEMLREMKNARLAGRTSLRDLLKNLVTRILSQNVGTVKEEAR